MACFDWFDFDHQKYGSFRSQLDDLVARNELTAYMKKRLLANTTREEIAPALDFENDPHDIDHIEQGNTLFYYFLDHVIQVKPILEAILTNLRELKTDQQLAQDYYYPFGLGGIVAPEISTHLYFDHGCKEELERYNLEILELLRGGKDHYDPHDFCDKIIECLLLKSFEDSYYHELTPTLKLQASTWLASYVNHPESGNKTLAGHRLFELDYNRGFQVLASLANDSKNHPDWFYLPAWLTTGPDTPTDLAQKIMGVVNEEQAITIRRSLVETKIYPECRKAPELTWAMDKIAARKLYKTYSNLFPNRNL